MSLLNPTVSATTLSVLLSATDSITCYVELDGESCNLTLRFDSDNARLAGYPDGWKTWDESITDGEELIYEDAEQDGSIDSFVDEIESIDAYVSRYTEKEIFNQLKKSLEKQFADEDLKDQLNAADKESVLEKLDTAIKNL